MMNNALLKMSPGYFIKRRMQNLMLTMYTFQKWRKDHVKARHQRIIKIIHLFSACLWGGATASMTLIQCLFQPENTAELHASSALAMYIELYLVVPSAFGCLLSGFAYAALTNFGFFKFKWILFKWIVNIGYLVFGFIWYMPWLENLVSYSETVSAKGIAETLIVYLMRISMDVFQILVVFIIVCVSVLKPWGSTTR
ncbi:MAG: hypothetical protein CL942_14855 [Desulfovibrio sp.]|nr:hypothetical protein [Desulfovibrio sp.]|tara:strand:+ start:1474 stop:2064 length:591 start_codon:yes stop_codon:yes gene_type:complete